jgi:hypothetical protein
MGRGQYREARRARHFEPEPEEYAPNTNAPRVAFVKVGGRQPSLQARPSDLFDDEEMRQHRVLVAACVRRALRYDKISPSHWVFKRRGNPDGAILFEAYDFRSAVQWADKQELVS